MYFAIFRNIPYPINYSYFDKSGQPRTTPIFSHTKREKTLNILYKQISLESDN